jgi:aspartyl-tRNA(Asn)/glutamyl-tRNA(Gln) amidotransferase subunit C
VVGARGRREEPPRITAVIEREQVLHVAKLARLRLSDAEVERMAGELSGILEHVDRISELELDDVAPTSHVVDLENVLRADEPRPSRPREAVLAQAPDPVDGAFRVPSPRAEA